MTELGTTSLGHEQRRFQARHVERSDDHVVPIERMIDDAVSQAVLPRLRRALGTPFDRSAKDREPAARLGRREIKPRDIERLIALVMGSGPDAARVLIDGLMAHGCDRATIFCDLLAPLPAASATSGSTITAASPK